MLTIDFFWFLSRVWGTGWHELRSEYELSELLEGGVRGKYAGRYRQGTNLVLLAPDVAEVFTDEESVNEALRLVMKLA